MTSPDEVSEQAVHAAVARLMADKYARRYIGSTGYAATIAQMVIDEAAPHIRAQADADQAIARDRLCAEVDRLQNAIAYLTDPTPCWFDHHGYCQAHGWLTAGECPHARAKRLLATTTPEDGNA